jgi:predicted phage baseplate assembly protein
MRADYDYGVGQDGNVGAGSINSSPSLPAGLKVTNPLRTWGGSEAESVAEAEKQISRYLQHRDRLVTVDDFKTITKRTPGVDIGRIEVLSAYNPELGQNEPGDAPGAVTVMVIPKYDVTQPDAPSPDRLFLDAVCDHLESRRLVTTEVFLRGPKYKPIWISVGINVMAGMSVAQVREDVKKALLEYLSPLPKGEDGSSSSSAGAQSPSTTRTGWPLRKSVIDVELLAEANRVTGVLSVNKVLLAEGSGATTSEVKMSGLELPRVVGISITPGEATDLDQLRGQAAPPSDSTTTSEFVSVPVIPEECL